MVKSNSPIMNAHFRNLIDFAVKRTFPIILMPQVPKAKITKLINAVLDDEENKITKIIHPSKEIIILLREYSKGLSENSI